MKDKRPTSSKNNPNHQDANRDPLTGEPGSHPVGTGVGALGAGAAGGAIGAVGGPIGAGIGAAVGAVIGGLGGKAAAEHFDPTEAGPLGRFLDYTVVDHDEDKIGTIDAVWTDGTGQPAYIAVRTGSLGMGKAHIVPVTTSEVNDERKIVRIPHSAQAVKNSPAFDASDDLDEKTEFTITSHFGLQRRWTDEDYREQTRLAQEARAQNLSTRPTDATSSGTGGTRLRKISRPVGGTVAADDLVHDDRSGRAERLTYTRIRNR